MWLHLTTRVDYPRFTTSRYRLATSLSMASDVHVPERSWWEPGADTDRARIVGMLHDRRLFVHAARTASWRRTVARTAQEIEQQLGYAQPTDENERRRLQAALLLVTRGELRDLRLRVSNVGVLWSARRQTERHWWFRLFRDSSRRRALRERAITGGIIVDARLTLVRDEPTDDRQPVIDRLIRRADRAAAGRTADAGTFYNVACLHALLVPYCEERAGPRRARPSATASPPGHTKPSAKRSTSCGHRCGSRRARCRRARGSNRTPTSPR